MNQWEADLLELRLAEQALYKQSLTDKDARLREQETEIRYLRRLLNEVTAAPRPAPVLAGASTAVPVLAGGNVPRRWKT
jgi:hypothetical protein